MSERVTWAEPGGMRKPLIRMFQELSTELFGDDAFQKQQEALEDGLIKIPSDQPLRHSVDRFFAINRELTYLGTDGEPYSVQQLNKILIKALPIIAMAKYVENGGDKLTSETEVTQAIRLVNTYLILQKKVQAHQREVA